MILSGREIKIDDIGDLRGSEAIHMSARQGGIFI